MKSIKQLFRLLYINYILAKNGLDQVVVTIRLFAPFRFIVFLNPWNWFRKEKLPRGEALCKTLIELGPIFVKFGQALSTRPDILPADIAQSLNSLQDNVPPFPSEQALAIIETSFGRSAFDIFAKFDSVPLASASMAQVHAATLKTGEDVVVKILRPNMRNKIEQDLGILYTIAGLAHRYWSKGKRLKPREIVKEFERSLFYEMDLQREAANTSQLRHNFLNSPLLYVPEVHWDYVRKNVLVVERIYGIPVTDVASLRQHGINIKKLAERGIEIFFTQVFRDCFFHADMHPGNIFVSYESPENPQYISVDCGIIGTLSDEDKRYLAENLLAFFNRDYRRVAQLHIASGWVARDSRVEEFENDIRTVCEPIMEKPLEKISFGLLVGNLFQVARRYNMEVQPQFTLLHKTLLTIEGLGRQLYPQLDLWATAKPFLQKWIKDQVGPRAFIRNVKENIPFIAEQLPHMPRLINDILVLTKEQKIATQERMANWQQTTLSNENNGYVGFGVGIFSGMLAVSGIVHYKWLDAEQVTSLTLATALIGVIIALLSKNRR